MNFMPRQPWNRWACVGSCTIWAPYQGLNGTTPQHHVKPKKLLLNTKVTWHVPRLVWNAYCGHECGGRSSWCNVLLMFCVSCGRWVDAVPWQHTCFQNWNHFTGWSAEPCNKSLLFWQWDYPWSHMSTLPSWRTTDMPVPLSITCILGYLASQIDFLSNSGDWWPVGWQTAEAGGRVWSCYSKVVFLPPCF